MEYPITVSITTPDKLSRLTTFSRVFMLIPHWLALYFLGIAAAVVQIIAWFAILFTARYPKWAFNLNSGYLRWYSRAMGYYLLLTDKYPRFTLK